MTKELKEMIKCNNYPKKQFSKEQLSNMRSIDLVDFMTWYDESKIIKLRGSVRLADNRSVVLHERWAKDFAETSDYCSGIDFCIKYLGLSTYGAMYVMNEFLESGYIHREPPPRTLTSITTIENRIANGQYIPANNIKPIYAYLCNTRQIPAETVKKFIDSDYLYAEKLRTGYNLLFPIYNNGDKIIGFEKSGILSDIEHRYKGCVISEVYTGFTYQYKYIDNTPEVVIVFESSIDLMSFVALVDEGLILLPEDRSIMLLSLRGLQGKVLSTYTNKDSTIILCVDNDTAGNSFYTEEHYHYHNMVHGGSVLARYNVKDWNDLLKIKNQVKTPINFKNLC